MTFNVISHADFIKIRQWLLLEAVHGTYLEQMAREYRFIQETKALYGFVPHSAYNEIKDLRKHWARPALLSRKYCIDVETGELYEPNAF